MGLPLLPELVRLAQGAETDRIKTLWDTAKGAAVNDPPPLSQADAQISNEKNGTRDYLGGISYHSIDRAFATVLCRANNKAAKYSLQNTAGVESVGLVGTNAGDGAAAACLDNPTVVVEVK